MGAVLDTESSSGKKINKQRKMLSEINVTPFVDVMLVLLIIFMVTAPMMQQGLNVDLPETISAGVSVSNNPFVLVIKKNKKIFIDSFGKTKNSSQKLKQEVEISLNHLGKKISAILTARKDQQIYIQADKMVSYGLVAQVLAELQSAGLNQVSLITTFHKK